MSPPSDGSQCCVCYKCKVSIKQTDITIKCAGFCRKLFHPQCVTLKDSDVRFLAKCDGFGWTCQPCREQITEGESLLQVLKVVLEKVQANSESLTRHENKIYEIISTINNNNNHLSTINKDAVESRSATYCSIAASTSRNVTRNKQTTGEVPEHGPAIITSSQVATAIMSAKKHIHELKKTDTTKANLTKNNNIDSSAKTQSTSHVAIDPRPIKRNNKTKVIGTAVSDNTKFAAVNITKRTWIHVSGFHKDLEVHDIQELLENKFKRNDFLCFKINPKHKYPKFSSFKIGADLSLKEQLLNPSLWNKGIVISEFDFFRAARNKV